MDLGKPVVQPSCLYLRSGAGVGVVHGDEPVHLRSDLLRWAILMDRAVRPIGIVRQALVIAAEERDLRLSPAGVDTFQGILVPRHQGVKFLDVACGQGPLVFHEQEHTFDRRFMILDHGHGGFRVRTAPMGDQGRLNTALDE